MSVPFTEGSRVKVSPEPVGIWRLARAAAQSLDIM